jgi:septum formation protein
MMIETQDNRTGQRTLVLASASSRRHDLLKAAGYRFEVHPSFLAEPDHKSHRISAEQYAESNSYFKARQVAERFPDALILAADTIVAYDNEVFGKPADVDDARKILFTLSGTTHRVITGITLLDPAESRRLICHDTTAVTMRPMSEQALADYLATGAWHGKAGAYGIQNHGDAYIERIDGSFSNVVGLPMELLADMLREFSAGDSPSNL